MRIECQAQIPVLDMQPLVLRVQTRELISQLRFLVLQATRPVDRRFRHRRSLASARPRGHPEAASVGGRITTDPSVPSRFSRDSSMRQISVFHSQL